MIELGKTQILTVDHIRDFGVYLTDPADPSLSVLLPKKFVPAGTAPDSALEVFVYRDSQDRLIATTQKPLIEVGQTAVLEVKDVSKIGAFLDMGLEKDVLLPFKEQSYRVEKGDSVLVALYVDKSGRLAATMRVYPYLHADPPYAKDDVVSGTVYELNESMGAFVAVDNCYYGLIPKQEIFAEYRLGQTVTARVGKVREDGKLDLSPRQKAYRQMDADAALILERIEEKGGRLPFTDKADPEIIRREFHLSKNAFKRAVGRLLKEKKIRITDSSIVRF